MALRRYSAIQPSAGTRWPLAVREAAYHLHGGCIGPAVGMPGPCSGGIELDHIRSGGMGMKSASTLPNAAPLCSVHHRLKTNEGKRWRPRLIALVQARLGTDCGHVEPVHGCSVCFSRFDVVGSDAPKENR